MLWAAVPEAAINKHGHMSTGEHDVGSTAFGKLSVKAEPRAGRMKGLAKADLWRRALLATTRKVPAFSGPYPLLGHPRRLAREGYGLLLHQLLFECVGSRRQNLGARIQVRAQDC